MAVKSTGATEAKTGITGERRGKGRKIRRCEYCQKTCREVVITHFGTKLCAQHSSMDDDVFFGGRRK